MEATTGSGKTLAFGIPIFEILKRNMTSASKYCVGALVVAPTRYILVYEWFIDHLQLFYFRELAQQIFDVLARFSTYYSTLKCMLLIGGTSIETDIETFNKFGAQILIGTPGRIMDVLNRCNSINLKGMEVLVLDEADTLLDMGFRKTIDQILSLLPKQRRTGLFSATQTTEVKELARAGMRNPVTVTVKVQRGLGLGEVLGGGTSARAQATPSTLENLFAICNYENRPGQLCRFLRSHSEEKTIVFVATCACVEFYSTAFAQLSRGGHILPATMQVLGLHGKMVMKKRKGLYDKFVQLAAGVIFCTDLAARGQLLATQQNTSIHST